MVTFFACPKPFVGHIDTIQRNALRSWTLLSPEPEIILLGADQGVAEICKELRLIHSPDVDRNEYGTPLVSSVFQIGQTRASHTVVCYINSDIMLTNDFVRAIETVADKMPRFLVLGQRTDIDVNETWNFDAADWEADLKSMMVQHGTLHGPTGIDFFCFRRGMYKDVPPFAIGRLYWDNWLVWRVRKQGIPIVDVTEAVAIAHQNHGYAPGTIDKLNAPAVDPGSQARASENKLWFKNGWFELGPEAQRNLTLAPAEQVLHIWAATWMIDREGRLRRRRLTLTPAYIYYQLKCMVRIHCPPFYRMLYRQKRILMQ